VAELLEITGSRSAQKIGGNRSNGRDSICSEDNTVDQVEPTDEELVSRVLAGEHHVYETLMRRHNRRLFRAIRGVVRDDGETEDVMQEAYVNAYAHLSSFRGSARFATWLTRIALHEAFKRVRKGKRYEQASEEDEMEAIQPTPEDAAGDRELGQVLERAIDALPEAYRTVFMLRAVEELSTAETAELLEIPDDTVKTRLHRARGILQKSLLERANAATPEAFGFHLSRCDRVVEGVFRKLGLPRA